MKNFLLKFLLMVSVTGSSPAATVVFDNLTALGDGAYGIRDASGTLVSGSEFVGALGRFTITNSAISASFAANDFASIQTGLQQFDPVNGSFALDNFASGAFQASKDFDTKDSVNPGFGGSTVYAVFFRGSSISAATELFIAQLTSTFPTDPEVGAALTANVSLRPDTVANVVVGYANLTPFDYGFGSGPLSTFGMAQAIPEPSRALLLGLAGMLTLFRRRRA